MSLRDEIEAAPRYGRSHYAAPIAKDENGPYMLRTDVLRIIDKHAAPVVGITPGMQSPRSDGAWLVECMLGGMGGERERLAADEPAWRKELALYRERRPDSSIANGAYEIWRELEKLAELRGVIMTGKEGQAVVPAGVRELLDVPPFERPPADADRVGYRPDGYPLGWIGKDRWRIIHSEEKTRIMTAIDSYANGLLS